MFDWKSLAGELIGTLLAAIGGFLLFIARKLQRDVNDMIKLQVGDAIEEHEKREKDMYQKLETEIKNVREEIFKEFTVHDAKLDHAASELSYIAGYIRSRENQDVPFPHAKDRRKL